MDRDSAIDTVDEEHDLPVEETDDDSCRLELIEITPLTGHTDGTECVSGDWSDEEKHENLTVVKQEFNDVCFCIYVLQFTTAFAVYYSHN